MKKFDKILATAAVCLISVGLVLSAVTLIFGISGVSYGKIWDSGLWNAVFHVGDDYDNEFAKDNQYRVSAETVKELSVNWQCGDIELKAYDGDDILLREYAGESLDEATCLRYKVEKGSLEIEFCRSEIAVSLSETPEAPVKKLVISVPEKLAENLDDLEISTDASDITAEGFSVRNLEISDNSGDFYGKNLDVKFADVYLDEGTMQADFTSCPKDLYFSSTEGSCLLGLPKNSSALVAFDTDSGDVYSQFHGGRLSKNVLDDGELTLGEGEYGELTLYTVSGDIRLMKGSCF